MQEIKNKNINLEKENYSLLNMRVYEKLNEHLLNKIKIINRLKTDSIEKYDNVEYELYLTPDTTKVKLFTKMMEIKKAIQNMENKIGNWDVVKIILNFTNFIIFLNFLKFFLEIKKTICKRNLKQYKKQPSPI
jgi:ATP-dependent Zn protease